MKVEVSYGWFQASFSCQSSTCLELENKTPYRYKKSITYHLDNFHNKQDKKTCRQDIRQDREAQWNPFIYVNKM